MRLSNIIVNTFKTITPQLPEHPVYVGDVLYEFNSSSSVLEKYIQFLITARILGLTWHQGRSALVVDFVGSITIDGNGEMNISGYGLFDVLAGAWVFSEMLMTHPTTQTREIMKLGLPEASRNIDVRPLISSSKNVESRLRKLKRLQNKGLITPDEAAAKRKEILNSL